MIPPALFLPALAALSGLLGQQAQKGSALEESAGYKITVFRIWATDEAQTEKLPKELEKFTEQLKKRSKKKFFCLDGKPSTETLRPGKTFSLKLPSGYEARWTIETEKEKTVVRQVLVNPKKEESVIDLKQSPVVNNLEKIQKGKATLLLVVQFEKTAK